VKGDRSVIDSPRDRWGNILNTFNSSAEIANYVRERQMMNLNSTLHETGLTVARLEFELRMERTKHNTEIESLRSQVVELKNHQLTSKNSISIRFSQESDEKAVIQLEDLVMNIEKRGNDPNKRIAEVIHTVTDIL